MQNKGITLLGMPGSGKTTIGKLLANDLKLEFVDLDDLIKKETSISANEYLEKYGDEKLTELEEKITLNLNLGDKLFSPGGSLVYRDRAMKKVRRETTIVYLKVPLGVLKKRITNLETRAIVGFKKHGFEYLYKQRSPLYQKYADIMIFVKNEEPEAVKKILFRKIVEISLNNP